MDRLLSINPDLETLKAFRLNRGIDIVLVFTGETAREGRDRAVFGVGAMKRIEVRYILSSE